MRIELTRSTIRPWTREDAPSLAHHANDRSIWLHLRDFFPHPYSLTDAETYLDRVTRLSPARAMAIEIDGEACGGISAALEDDVHRYSAEIGYWLGKDHWGKGIMTEVVGAFTDYLFSTFGLLRVHAMPYANNPASGRTLGKNGFVLEGRMRQSVVKDGQILDQLLYAKTIDFTRQSHPLRPDQFR